MERPILFKAPMVQAILAGRKNQTRRIINFDIRREARLPSTINFRDAKHNWRGAYDTQTGKGDALKLCPYGVVGDRLWVKETFVDCSGRTMYGQTMPDNFARYRADEWDLMVWPSWTPSLFMPRRLSRILLEITNVRVQRLKSITDAEARAEGCVNGNELGGAIAVFGRDVNTGETMPATPRNMFQLLWDSINAKKAPFASNPYVWAITFQRLYP